MTEQKTYWGSVEELEAGTDEHQRREFVSPPMKEEIGGMERRDFLKLMGTSLLFAGLASCRRPIEKVIPYVNKPEEITPGIANWYTSTCHECAAGCGLLVKTREGRPIKLEGNPDHPINQGGLCARGQASIINLYYGGRLQYPVQMKGDAYERVNWEAVDQAVGQHLEPLKKTGRVYILTGAVMSPSTRKLINEFLKAYPGSAHVAYAPAAPEEIALAQEASYGVKLTPRYRFDKAQMIVAFGADFLGTWLSPVEFSKKFSQGRRLAHNRFSQLVSIESALSLTGTNADRRLAVAPGDEIFVALSLAHEIIVNGGYSKYALDGAIHSALSPYSVDAVAGELGLAVGEIKKIAKDLWDNRGQGLIVGGAVHGPHAYALEVVANLLNTALENDGATVDWAYAPSEQVGSSWAELKDLVAVMSEGKVAALFIADTNPVYHLPPQLQFAQALKKVPLVVHLAGELNETSYASHYVAPTTHYLEQWTDSNPQKGVFGLGQPTISPLFENRSFQDSLCQWAGLGMSWYAYLQSYWRDEVAAKYGAGSFDAFWADMLKRGYFAAGSYSQAQAQRLSDARRFNPGALKGLPALASRAKGYSLVLYPSVALYDGRSASNPWLQELPDPVSKITWDNYISVAPKTARALKLKEGHGLRVKVGGMVAELPIHIQPMLHESSLMAAVGYGRTKVGELPKGFGYSGVNLGAIGENTGVHTFSLQGVSSVGPVWHGRIDEITKTGRISRLATTQGHHTVAGRPIIKETTYEEYLKNPAASHNGHPHHMTMWSKHDYPGHKWGMAIDLSVCTGCSGCMIGCQTENNVGIVGKEQVIRGRDMHWLRIDRYYQGDLDQPEVVYQPMLCQHCDNAPCETVCPVIATEHNKEGLNEMIYNRCVGTRYCANNCPYKVRRFNYFEYAEEFKSASPLHLMLNPDITTREQGVMEKCTFCMQRIRGAKDTAKDEGRAVGEIKTACQQSCPTDAIVFGDLNDPNSLVSKLRHEPRGYHVLDELNTVPNITYLAKVRNKA